MSDIVERFREWRAEIRKQQARGNPYCSHKPENRDVLAMMDEIDRLRVQVERQRKALQGAMVVMESFYRPDVSSPALNSMFDDRIEAVRKALSSDDSRG